MVERHLRLASANQFKAVVRTIPVDGRTEMDNPFCLTLQGRKQFGGVLVLFIIFGTIKGVRAPASTAYASVPVQANQLFGVSALIEGFHTAVVAVQGTCFRTLVAITTCEIGRKGMIGNGHASCR